MQDALQIFSAAQVITTASVASSKAIDMLVARDIGVGNMLEINVQVHAAFTIAGSAPAIQIALQGSVTAGGGGTYYDILLSPVIAVTALTLGAKLFQVPVPRLWQPNMKAIGMPQYIQLYYTLSGGTFTLGSLDAWLSAAPDREAYYTYPKNYVTA